MLRVGILGMGGMGWFHTSRYLRLPDVSLVAIADVTPERLQAENFVQMNIDAGKIVFDSSTLRRYSDPNSLLRDTEIDVIDICLPTELHAGWSQAAIPFQAGFQAWFDKGFIRFSNDNLDVYG